MKRKLKRGSHVGLVLSFIIFIVFLVYLYAIIEPAIKVQKDKESFLNYLEVKLEKEFSSNLTTTTIKIEESINPVQNCFVIENIIGNIIEEPNLVIKGESEDILDYSISGDSLNLETGTSFSGFLKIYSSEEFEYSPSFDGQSCGSLTQVSTGLVKTEKKIFESKIIESIAEYKSNYEDFKSELNTPEQSEFSFSFIYSNGTKIFTEESNLSTNVYVQKIPIQYIDKEANINSGFIDIKVW